MTPLPIPQTSAAQPAETVEARFRRLAAIWHPDTDYLSSMSESDSHPAYQEIIRLGPAVVPILLRDLEENHTHWFGALQAITGANPVPTSAGNIPQMTEVWLRWAKDHGYQWQDHCTRYSPAWSRGLIGPRPRRTPVCAPP